VGIFNKRDKGLRLANGQRIPRFDDYSPSSMKETMKAFGLEPAESARELFGWTEEDDNDGKIAMILRKKNLLKESLDNGCSLREEMELEIEIDGLSN
jgi:hypothetical protein